MNCRSSKSSFKINENQCMTMGAYKYIVQGWNKRSTSQLGRSLKEQLITWRREPAVLRLNRPTRIDRARSLGYRAKQGFIIARTRIRKGGARKPRPVSGRRPKTMGVNKFTRAKSLKTIAEERTARKFPNLKVLNSYWVAEDGKHAWYEIVLADGSHPAIGSDAHLTASQ